MIRQWMMKCWSDVYTVIVIFLTFNDPGRIEFAGKDDLLYTLQLQTDREIY